MLKGASTGTTVLSYAESTQEVFQLQQSRKFLPAATVVSRNSHDWPLLSPVVPTSLGIGGDRGRDRALWGRASEAYYRLWYSDSQKFVKPSCPGQIFAFS
jgi:hypothetical protein